jgi:subtilisin family serine protease
VPHDYAGTYPGGTYASASGTSFSSQIVAGTAALLLSAKSASLNQSQAASAFAHARVLTPNLNHGRLDIYQAVSAWVNSSGTSSTSSTCTLLCL